MNNTVNHCGTPTQTTKKLARKSYADNFLSQCIGGRSAGIAMIVMPSRGAGIT